MNARIAAIQANNDHMALSDLTRLECRVGPLQTGDLATLARSDSYFKSASLRVIPLTSRVCDLAAEIRARQSYGLGDAFNLAAAIDAGSDRFLTNDARLSGFPNLAREVLR